MPTINSPSTKSDASASGTRTRSPRLAWLWLLLVPLLAAILFLLRPAADAEQVELEARRRQIENMSTSERERLDKNFEQFQKLSEERKEALREIEETVREDEDLKSTLLTYERWLNTLSPWERAELRNAGTLGEKVAFVNTIAAARREEAMEMAQRQTEWEELAKKYLTNFQGPGQRSGGRSRVSENDLSNMMAVLEADHGSRVKPSPTALPGRAAYNIQLLAEALKAGIEKNELEKAREQPLPDKTVQKMLEQIPDSDTRALFKDYDAKQFVKYLAWKVEWAWWNEAKQNPPSHDELDEIAKTLGGEILEKFEEQKKDDPHRAYFRLLMATRPATFHTDTKDLDEVMAKLELRERKKGPPVIRWYGGPDRRGDHRRGDRDRDRDRDRDENCKDDDEADDKHRRGKDKGEA